MSQSLQDKEEQAIQAEISRANEESMNRVQMNLGRLDSSTIDLSHYLNKKIIRKGELEAFKWSFIFSQFARPFQDSLDDVFGQSVFQQMETNDTMISSVSSVLGAAEYMSITDAEGLMLSSSKYRDLSRQIKGNLIYNTLYTKDGAPVVLNDLLSDKFNANTIFYIYDKVEKMGLSDEEMIDLYYNQGKLASGGSQYDLQTDTIQVPALPYNNTTFMYLQLAVGSYCRQMGIDLGTLRSTKGGGTLYLDSYGNTCVYDGDDFKIVIPNFGNPIFINEVLEGNQLEERIFLYNKWIGTCYSKKLRPSNDPQPVDGNGFPSIFVLGDNDPYAVDNADKEPQSTPTPNNAGSSSQKPAGGTQTDGTSKIPAAYGDGASFYLSEFLNTSQTGVSKQDKYGEDTLNVKDSMVLVDPPTLTGFKKLEGFNLPHHNIQDRVNWIVNKQYADLASSVYGTFDGQDWIFDTGTITSPSVPGRVGFAGDAGNTDKFPLIQGGKELKDAANGSYWSVVKAFSRIVDNRTFDYGEDGKITWNSSGIPILVKYSGNVSAAAPANELISSINNYYSIFFAFDYNKTIDNGAFIAKAGTSDSTWAAMMFINDDIVDYGQNMNVYMEGTEKGMYLPEYRLFFTGNTKQLLEGLHSGLSRASKSVQGSTIVSAKNDATKDMVFPMSLGEIPAGGTYMSKLGKKNINTGANLSQRLAYLSEMLDYELNGKGALWWKTWDASNSYQNVYAAVGSMCAKIGLDPKEVMQAMMILSDDWLNSSKYFYLPQWYLVARDNKYSPTMGCNTVDDFVLSTYFWDRYYLTKTPMNRELFRLLYEDSSQVIDKYQKHEVDWLSTPGAVTKTDSEGNIVRDASGKPEVDISACSALDLQTTYYNSLASGDIVFFPRAKSTDYKLRLHWSIMDEMWDSGNGAFGTPTNREITVNYHQLLMALQKNTDYEHNYQITPMKGEVEKEHISLEKLMDDAYYMLSNPVKALTTVLTGLLYDLHRLLGTGTLGSSFDLNWLLTNKLYLAVSEWYVVMLVVMICIMCFIKVIQYCVIQHMNFGAVAKRMVAGVLLTMTPLILFRGFVWIFSHSSQGILQDSLYRTILSQTQTKQLEKINADANVDSEILLFREQFDNIESKYDGITFNTVDYYDYSTRDLVYKEESLTSMLEKTKLNWTKGSWYDYRGFVPVNQEHYDDSLFYFFYDYLKSMYIRYYASNIEAETSAMRVVALKYNYGDSDLAKLDEVQRKDLQLLEQNFAQTKGNFRAMMRDSLYVYGASALKENQGVYGKPRVKDLVGYYKIFQSPDIAYSQPGIGYILDSEYYTWMKQQPIMAYNRVVPAGVDVGSNKTWTNPELIRHATGRDWLYTSYLDMFNQNINTDYDSTYATYQINTPKTTPFEEALFEMNEEIYDRILEVLDYCPTQISDESAITISALIATFVTSDYFNMEPTLPILGSVNMDTLLRCALIKNAANMDSGINLFYAMLNEGYGLFSIIAVIMMELFAALLLYTRISLICVILVGSTIWAVWRFLTHDPRKCKLLIYGVVGNFVAVTVLHFACVCLTNFLVMGMSFMGRTVIGSILMLVLLTAAYLVLGFVHGALILWIIKNPFDLGGKFIHDRLQAVQHMMANGIDKFSARIHRQNAMADQVEQEIKEAQVDIENESASIDKANALTVNQVNRVISSMEDAEIKSSDSQHLWDGTIDTVQVDNLVFNNTSTTEPPQQGGHELKDVNTKPMSGSDSDVSNTAFKDI